MKRSRRKTPSPATVISVIALVAACSGSAFAAAKIGSGDIKDDAVKSKHIADDAVGSGEVENRSIRERDIDEDTVDAFLSGGTLGAPGIAGQNGADGEDGTDGINGTNGLNGADGAAATYVGPNWTQNLRNTDPGADAYLSAGPTAAAHPSGDITAPPFGVGSLVLNNDASEASHFSNEVDFFGDEVAGISELGFHVFTTGENAGRGEPMPNIKFEIDPNLAAGGDNFSTMVWVPDDPVAADINVWSGYRDATSSGEWFLTGTEGGLSGCTQASLCTFSELQDGLDDGSDPATVRSAGVGKGRDTGFVGAIDGLQINDTVYDFEPFGVEEEPAS